MQDKISQLLEWTIFYVKNKDMIKKEMTDYKIIKDSISFEYRNNKNHTYQIRPELDDSIMSNILKDNVTIVCLNKLENLNFMIKVWEKLIPNKTLSFVFVNAKENQKWAVTPYIHDKISDKNSLKAGLRSLFESITPA